MAWKVNTVTENGKFLYNEIIDDGKPSWIKQTVVEVRKDMIKVVSSKGNMYWVAKSDKVMTMDVKPKDVAVVGTFKSGWLVTDVLRHIDEVVDEDDDEELQRQLKEFNILGGGY